MPHHCGRAAPARRAACDRAADHQPPPRQGTTAIAIPSDVKARIGLDRARPAWVVVDDANVFTWPGFDLVPQRGETFVRATVTRGFFQQVRAVVLAVHARGRPRRVERDAR